MEAIYDDVPQLIGSWLSHPFCQLAARQFGLPPGPAKNSRASPFFQKKELYDEPEA
jgi:hypothetical protein